MPANPPAGAQSASESEARGDGERSDRPFLLYADGEGRQQRFSLEPGLAQASIGRGRASDLALDWDEQVSRLHARLEPAGEGWAVVDDGSRNGTFLNGERLSGRRGLTDGDLLRVGATTMTFRSPGGGERAGAAPERAGAAPPEQAAAAPRPAPPSAAEPPPGVELSTTQRRVLVALCRPYKQGSIATPATDEQIAEELFLHVGVVRTHLRILFAKLGVDQLPPEEKRAGLVERAFGTGTISESDL